MEWTLIIFFIIMTALSGYFLKLLTWSGSLAASIIGIAVALGFGVKGLLLLGFFFASSSFWSKFKRKAKAKAEERHEKGSQRDWQQVVANGGAAAIFSLLYFYFPLPIFIVGYGIAIASANSDTWASEIGSLSKRPPIFIRTLKRIETGTSGAISFLGTMAAIFGSLTVALLAYLFIQPSFSIAFIIFLFGFLGNVIDTIFGAFFQATYRCNVCQSEVESLVHCGDKTTIKKGHPMFNNDFVNFFSGLLAAIFGLFTII